MNTTLCPVPVLAYSRDVTRKGTIQPEESGEARESTNPVRFLENENIKDSLGGTIHFPPHASEITLDILHLPDGRGVGNNNGAGRNSLTTGLRAEARPAGHANDGIQMPLPSRQVRILRVLPFDLC